MSATVAGAVSFKVVRGSSFDATDCGGPGSYSAKTFPNTGIQIQAVMADGSVVVVYSTPDSRLFVNSPESSTGGWFSSFSNLSIASFAVY
jgi:hypothetical protein